MKPCIILIVLLISYVTTGQDFNENLVTDYCDCISEKSFLECESLKDKILKKAKKTRLKQTVLESRLHEKLVFECESYFQHADTIRYFEIKNRNRDFLDDYDRFENLSYFNDLLENGTDEQKQEIRIHRGLEDFGKNSHFGASISFSLALKFNHIDSVAYFQALSLEGDGNFSEALEKFHSLDNDGSGSIPVVQKKIRQDSILMISLRDTIKTRVDTFCNCINQGFDAGFDVGIDSGRKTNEIFSKCRKSLSIKDLAGFDQKELKDSVGLELQRSMIFNCRTVFELLDSQKSTRSRLFKGIEEPEEFVLTYEFTDSLSAGRIHYLNGYKYWLQNEDDKALVEFDKAISLKVYDIHLLLWRGLIMEQKERFSEARSNYIEALGLGGMDPDDIYLFIFTVERKLKESR